MAITLSVQNVQFSRRFGGTAEERCLVFSKDYGYTFCVSALRIFHKASILKSKDVSEYNCLKYIEAKLNVTMNKETKDFIIENSFSPPINSRKMILSRIKNRMGVQFDFEIYRRYKHTNNYNRSYLNITEKKVKDNSRLDNKQYRDKLRNGERRVWRYKDDWFLPTVAIKENDNKKLFKKELEDYLSNGLY